MERLVLALEEDKLIWLRRIITDEDEEEALSFLRAVLGSRLYGAGVLAGLRPRGGGEALQGAEEAEERK